MILLTTNKADRGELSSIWVATSASSGIQRLRCLEVFRCPERLRRLGRLKHST